MNLNNRKYHVLIACLHYPVASGRYLARAFRRLGHEVKTVGPAMGRQVWGMEVDARHVWEPDALNPLADTWEPDLVLTSDSAYTTSFYDSPPTIPHVLYGVDNHVRDYRELPTETGHHRSDWDYKFLAGIAWRMPIAPGSPAGMTRNALPVRRNPGNALK